MKLAIVWKWWAWKTTLSVWLIKLLSQKTQVLAIDADSNKNLIDYLWFEDNGKILELWDLKPQIFKKAWAEPSEYDRKYYPKNWVWFFSTDKNDEIFSQVAYNSKNLDLIQLWEPRKARVWVTGMCPYNETIKVYLSNLQEKNDQIVWVDFAAWAEAVSKWIIASVDNIIIPLEPNSKNLDVAKDIYKTLKIIDFKNVYFVINKYLWEKDIEYINNYFLEKINIIWKIPFSKEIMKMDMSWEINIDLLSEELKQSFYELKNNILKLQSDRKVALERIKKLDILKWDKKCH